VSERRGCRVLLFYRSSHRYEAAREDHAVLRLRIREIAEARVRYGYYRIYILLRREGWKVNHKGQWWTTGKLQNSTFKIKGLYHAGMPTYWTTVEKRKKEALTPPTFGRRTHERILLPLVVTCPLSPHTW
jgi:transposase InsO family protein